MLLPNEQADLAEIILSDESPAFSLVYPIDHVRIYHHAILNTLTKTMMMTYSLLCKLLGEDFFHQTVKEYIACYPSRSSNLNDYGAHFGDFLSHYPETENLIYLAEVANFEWACHELQFSANATPLDIVKLAQYHEEQYEQLHFTLNPASRLMSFQYPLLHIIDLCEGKHDEDINLQQGGVYLLLLRKQFNLSLITLTKAEYTCLSALSENCSLQEALDLAQSHDQHFSLEEKLPKWIEDHVLTDCYLLTD